MYPEVLHDAIGCVTIVVRAEHLKDFPKLISWIREQGYFSNILKVHLHEEDRRDVKVLDETLSALNATLRKTVQRKEGKGFLYNPIAQLFYRASINDHVYEFMSADCTKEERNQFVNSVMDRSSYLLESNCCTELLKTQDRDSIRKHLFDSVAKIAPLNDTVRENEEILQGASAAYNVGYFPQESTPIIYGAGIQLDPDSHICLCDNFSLSKLNTVIDELDEKYDGIAFPYLYCGVKHSSFPWHIEDGGLYSINYLFSGSPKVWFGIAPSRFGQVDRIACGLRINKGHTSCRALLADHKALVVDPDYFCKSYGIPYTTVIQEVGDFIIAPPFALHSGFNLGINAAFAVNFGDVPWIELGIYAPVCLCRENQVHLNFVTLLKKWRPDLLEKYLRKTSLDLPPGHPCNVDQQDVKLMPTCTSESPSKKVSGLSSSKTSLRHRTLYCPKCPNKSYAENKMKRLLGHINLHHVSEKEKLLRVVKTKYPQWKPKTQAGFKCQVCGAFFRGSVTHVLKHHQKKHPGETFKRDGLQ